MTVRGGSGRPAAGDLRSGRRSLLIAGNERECSEPRLMTGALSLDVGSLEWGGGRRLTCAMGSAGLISGLHSEG